MAPAATPVKRYGLTDYAAIDAATRDSVLDAVTKRFPLENDRHILELAEVGYSPNEDFSLPAQKQAILDGRTVARKLKGRWVLRDKASGSVIDTGPRVTLANVPYLTPRGTYITNGHEMTIGHMLRMRPGVYSRRRNNGQYEALFNIKQGTGFPFKMDMDPETGVFHVNVKGTNVKLYQVLRNMGVPDETIRQDWGDDLFKVNSEAAGETTAMRSYNSALEKQADEVPPQQPGDRLVEALRKMELDPDSTSLTMGKPYDRVSDEVLRMTSRKLLDLARGRAEPDNRDSLEFQKVYGPPDLFAERIALDGGRVARNLLWKASGKGSVRSIPSGSLNPHIDSVFSESKMAQYIEGSSPMDAVDNTARISRIGVGGISDLDAAPDETRLVQSSFKGFIDPIRSPERLKVGLDMFAAHNVEKGSDGLLYAQLVNARTGKPEWVDSRTASLANIATAEYMDSTHKYVPIVKGSRTVDLVRRTDIDYYLAEPKHTLSLASNLVPFQGGIKGMRLLMGCLHPDELLVLKDSEGLIHVTRAGDIVEGHIRLGFQIESLEGRRRVWKPLRAVQHNRDEKSVVRVKLASGRDLRTTVDHKWMVASADGTMSKKRADKLVPGDRIPRSVMLESRGQSRRVYIPATCKAGRKPFDMNSDDAAGWLLGALFMTASNGAACANTLAAATPKGALDRLLAILDEHGMHPKFISYQKRAGKDSSYQVCCTNLRGWISRNLGARHKSRRIPSWIYNTPKTFRSGFLRAIMDTRSTPVRDNTIQLTFQTKELAYDIALLLRSLGIDCNIGSCARIRHILVCISAGGRGVAGLPEVSDPVKQAHIRATLSTKLTSQKIRRMKRRTGQLPGWTDPSIVFDMVDRVTPVGPVRGTVDLSVGDGVFATMSGIIVHNSKYANQALPLIDREAPLVQSARFSGADAPDQTFEETQGSKAGALFADKAGIVKAVTPDSITLTQADGRDAVVELYNNFPANHKGYLRSEAAVKPGDTVAPGQLLASSNYTDKKGALAMGRNLRTAFMSYRMKNFEDAMVISDSAAGKLSSEHMLHSRLPKAGIDTSMDRYLMLYPGKFSAQQMKSIGPDGLVKPGTELHKGDPMILGIRENEPSPGTLGRRTYTDSAVVWEHDYPGTVTDATTGRFNHTIYAKASVPATTGDKISNRFGNKGVVADIIPDSQMPHDARGRPYDILLSPQGILSRTNPTQLLELAYGKIAEKTGRRVAMPSFGTEGRSAIRQALADLRANGLSDTEDVMDPSSGRKIQGITTGNMYFYKLKHTAESKEAGRGTGGYTEDDTPASGGREGSKRISLLESQALVGHGVTEFMKDAKLIRGQKSDNFWRDLRLGRSPSMPGRPFVHDKLMAHIEGAGIRLTKDGDKLSIFGMTDRDAQQLTQGREVRSTDTYNARTYNPIDGGLFGKDVFGPDHNQWAYIRLDEPVPNPVMEDSLRRILNMSLKDYLAVAEGRKDLNGDTGGTAIYKALDRIDLKREIETVKAQLPTLTGARKDAAIKRVRAMVGMQIQDKHPKDFVLTRVPVLPPAFRPILKQGPVTMVSDSNYLYKALMESRDDLAQAKQTLPKELHGEARAEMYRDVKSLFGLSDPDDAKLREENVGGLLKWVFGKGSPKYGAMQRRVIGTAVDTVGRGTVVPNPSLRLNQIGIPEEQAWSIYEPFIVREMVRNGYKVTDAVAKVAERHPAAKGALEKVITKRPVVMNRAPSLHKFSLMGFWPVLTKGRTIQVSPSIVVPFGADFDGDQQIGKVVIRASEKVLKDCFAIPLNLVKGHAILSCIDETITGVKTMQDAKQAVVVKQNKQVAIVDLEDFPHTALERTTVGESGPIEIYGVPDDVEVLALDESTGLPKWVRPTVWSKHLDREVQIVNLKGSRQIITDDDPRAVYGIDTNTGKYTRCNPATAVRRGLMVPQMRRSLTLFEEQQPANLDWTNIKQSHPTCTRTVKDKIDITPDICWYVGAFAGYGWATMVRDIPSVVNMCGQDEDILESFRQITLSMLEDGDSGHSSRIDATVEKDPERYGDASTVRIHSVQLAEAMVTMLGHGCKNKRLPTWIFTAPVEYRKAVLGGLMDTKGTVCVVKAKAKKKSQLQVSFTTTNIRMARDFQLLARTLGIYSTISTFTYREDRSAWIVNLSDTDAYKWAGEGMRCRRKKNIFKNADAPTENSTQAAGRDVIPYTEDNHKDLHKNLPGIRRIDVNAYSALCKGRKDGHVSRLTLAKLFKLMPQIPAELIALKQLVDNCDIVWLKADNYEITGRKETGYDLTVPGYETFMNVDGVVLSNTVNVHVPVSSKAVNDVATKMMPEQNLLDVRNFRAHYKPMRDALQGLHLATRFKPGTESAKPLPFRTVGDARQAYRQGLIDIDTPITITGK